MSDDTTDRTPILSVYDPTALARFHAEQIRQRDDTIQHVLAERDALAATVAVWDAHIRKLESAIRCLSIPMCEDGFRHCCGGPRSGCRPTCAIVVARQALGSNGSSGDDQ